MANFIFKDCTEFGCCEIETIDQSSKINDRIKECLKKAKEKYDVNFTYDRTTITKRVNHRVEHLIGSMGESDYERTVYDEESKYLYHVSLDSELELSLHNHCKMLEDLDDILSKPPT